MVCPWYSRSLPKYEGRTGSWAASPTPGPISDDPTRRAGLWVRIGDMTNLHVHEWGTDATPKAIVQIAHGMAEHGGRYDGLAKFLADKGFGVIAADHRGHGQSYGDDKLLGYFAPQNGWDIVVEDLHGVRRSAEHRFPGLPYFMIGHSMGSMLLRDYLSRWGVGLAGAAIVGTGLWPGASGEIGLALAKALARFKPRDQGKLLNSLAFAGYNSGFEGRTDKDWLTRDEQIVDDYIGDHYAGYVPTNQFFVDLFSGLKRVNSDDIARRTPSKLPLYITSGSADPVGGEKAVRTIAEQYRRFGLVNVTEKVWPEARHEIFNETNRAEVYADLFDWMESVLA